MHVRVAFLVFLMLLLPSLPVRSQQPAPAGPTGEDAEQVRLLQEGRRRIEAGRSAEAIKDCLDKVLAAFEERYRDTRKQVFCARTESETLFYLLQSAKEKKEAVVIAPTWADAWFMKGYAFLELGQVPAAKLALERAIALSPQNSQYLSELGHCLHLEKDWNGALEVFRKAEEGASLASPDPVKIPERTRALRGQGYSLVELGKLEEAARKYQECLALNPDDATAKGELAYINSLLGH